MSQRATVLKRRLPSEKHPLKPLHQWGAAAAIVFLTGATALAHESLWTRRLSDVLGSTSEAAARVLGGLFLGLALGAAVAGAISRRIRRPWRAAGLAECCVGLLSLPVLTFAVWSESIWPWLGMAGVTGPQGDWLKLILSLLLVVPPAAAMGAVLPFVLVATPPRDEQPASSDLVLYGINTAGGIAGLLCLAFMLLPAAGASGAMLIAVCGNLLAGIALLALDRRQTRATASPQRVPAALASPRTVARALCIAFVSGFGVLAFEVLALQAFMLAAPLSYHSPAVFLAVVLAALAIGSWGAVRLLRRGDPLRTLSGMLPWCAVAIAATPWLFMTLAGSIGFEPEVFFEFFVLKALLFCVVAFTPGLLLLGLVFPLAAASCDESSEHRIPWGRLLAVNGIGGWIGAEFASGVLMPTFGIYAGFGIVALVMAVLGFAVALTGATDRVRTSLPAVGAFTVIVGLILGPLGRLPTVNPHLGFNLVDQRLNREGVVSVVEHDSFGRAFLMSNQYLLGSTKAAADERRQALLPLALHDAPRNVAFIGVATGITPGAALDVAGVERITAIELSRSVAELASEHFSVENRGVLADPRTQLVVEDARTVLAAATGEFDVVIGDLILPWSPGESRLYTTEHFASARRSLKPGGLYCQWIPMYQLTREHFATIARTFASVFPRAELLQRELGFRTPAVALLGWQDDRTVDWDVVKKRCELLRSDNRVLDPCVRHHESIAMLYLGSAKAVAGGGPLNTLDHPEIEVDAGRERVTGNPGAKYLSGGRWLNLKSELTRDLGRPSPIGQLARLGMLWSEHEAGLHLQTTESNGRRLELPPLALPPPLLDDRNAQWRDWPASWKLVERAFLAEGRTVSQTPVTLD